MRHIHLGKHCLCGLAKIVPATHQTIHSAPDVGGGITASDRRTGQSFLTRGKYWADEEARQERVVSPKKKGAQIKNQSRVQNAESIKKRKGGRKQIVITAKG